MSKSQELNIDTTNDLPKRKIPSDLPSLSVFELPYSWGSWSGFWGNIAYFFCAWKAAWHRATRGYCSIDTWNVDMTTCTYLIKVLTEFRNCTCCYPDQCFATFEDWIAYIDEIIDHLIYAMEDECKLNKYYEEWKSLMDSVDRCDWIEEQKQLHNNYIKEVQEVSNRQKEARIKAFTMLGAYIDHIWW